MGFARVRLERSMAGLARGRGSWRVRVVERERAPGLTERGRPKYGPSRGAENWAQEVPGEVRLNEPIASV